ncbi:MAG TPA: hypothetical protein VK046_14785 [Actinomycetaceae bacterium]|nr:hypothetical protein [Actinomycetaceae bacterium]
MSTILNTAICSAPGYLVALRPTPEAAWSPRPTPHAQAAPLATAPRAEAAPLAATPLI